MSTQSISLRRSPSQPSVISAISDFERIMKAIFILTGQAPPKDLPRQAYRLRVDNTIDLNLFPDPQGNLVVVGASRPVDTDIGSEHLLRLLQLNSYFHSTHHIAVGFLQQSRTMQVWSRHPMQRMKDRDVMRMLKQMANAISHVNAILLGKDN